MIRVLTLLMICLIISGCAKPVSSLRITNDNIDKIGDIVENSDLSDGQKGLFHRAEERYTNSRYELIESMAQMATAKLLFPELYEQVISEVEAHLEESTLIGKTVMEAIKEQKEFESKEKEMRELREKREEERRTMREEYVANHIELRDVRIEDSHLWSSTKYLRGEIKNKGEAKILKIEFTIYFLDETEKPIQERNFSRWYIKPNYTASIFKEIFYKSPDWSGDFELVITNLELDSEYE